MKVLEAADAKVVQRGFMWKNAKREKSVISVVEAAWWPIV